MKLILATTSKYKKKVFAYLGLPFRTEASKIDESIFPRKDPRKLVLALSKAKALAVASRYKEKEAIVIGLDSIGYFRRKILEKPKSKEEAIARLKELSGKRHSTFTGICMINNANGKILQQVVRTDVWFRKLSDEEIKKYVESDKDIFGICLGYDPETKISSSFAIKIKGSYNNLLNGMPTEVIPEMLERIK